MHDWKALVRDRLGPLRVDPAREHDIVEELAQHCAQQHADLVASGLSDAEALARTLAPLADRVRVAGDLSRADRPRPGPPAPPEPAFNPIVDLWRDVRYAARVLRRAPGFTVVAVFTLALGIGANTAIFSVVNAVLLRPLPYDSPGRLVIVGDRNTDGTAGNAGYLTVVDWRTRSRSFDDVAIVRSWSASLMVDGEPERVAGMRVTWNFFRMLGVGPALGRPFREAEDTPDRWRALLISDSLWRRRFHADPSVIGRVITISDFPFTIVGVMPRSFSPLISERFYETADVWAVLGYDATLPYACRTCQHLKVIGRLKPDVSVETASREINDVHAAMRGEYPASYPASSFIAVTPLTDVLAGGVRPALTVLMGAVVIVLLMACANVANLLLARAAGRQHDLALRTALGASRARLVRQMLVESVVLALAGGVFGVVGAVWIVPLLATLSPVPIARLADAYVDGRVLAFTLGTSLATALAFGLLPATRASRIEVQPALYGDIRQTVRGPASLARRVLIAVDVALAVVLLAGAGLMIKSVGRLLNVDPGFDPDRVLTMQIAMVGKAYAEDDPVVAKQDEILARLRQLPGVESVAMAGQIPLGGNFDRSAFRIDGRPASPDDPSVERYSVTPDYFGAMRIPLRRGRLFTEADRERAMPVMVIGEQTASRLWPHVDPLGRRAQIRGNAGPWYTIVGVVGDVRHMALAAPPTPQMYLPQAQLPDSFLTIVIRAQGDRPLLASEARRAIASVAPDVPVYKIAPLESLVAKSVGARRFVMLVLELFGALALLMTAVGVYGVISYGVAERTREIGIRSALGAPAGAIVRLVLGSGLAVVAVGLAAGVALAALATRYLQASLYATSATDPATFASVVLLLFLVAAAAQLVPLARALRVDPTIALRQH